MNFQWTFEDSVMPAAGVSAIIQAAEGFFEINSFVSKI